MFDSLPYTAQETLGWTWSDFEPYYSDLAERTLNDSNVTEYLRDWTRIAEIASETHSRLSVATTRNTADQDAEKRFHAFLENVFPKLEEVDHRLKSKLLEVNSAPDGFELSLKKMRADTEIFRESNLPLMTEEQKLDIEYDKIIGAQTVEWEGKEVTVTQLRPVYQDTSRDRREAAWRLSAERQMQDTGSITELWKRFLSVRLHMANNADFPDYRSYRWKEWHRFDYSPEDCKAFHKAIEETAVPAARRICERRKELLGLDSLRPWDMNVDPHGRPPLKPFEDVTELKEKTLEIFRSVGSTFGDYFKIMMDEDLLDLENRKNKAPGGYCTGYAAVKRPFIFMNAVGIHDDVQTLLHESGHCFHSFETARLPYIHQRSVGLEFSEVASMAMELLAAPYLEESLGGFYDKADANRALAEHLEDAVLFWPYMAVVDAFQHWVYENPAEAEYPEKCDEAWSQTWDRFIPWIDWSGLEEVKRTGWHRKLHIFVVPFYYVEYGLAQLGAVQVWGESLNDPTEAVKNYRHALSLGGTVDIPDLFAAAGAKFAFDAETLGRAVSLMERHAEQLNEEFE